MEKYCRGVGHSPISTTSTPAEIIPSINASLNVFELSLISLPTLTLSFEPWVLSFELRYIPYAMATALAASAVRSLLNTPRISYAVFCLKKKQKKSHTHITAYSATVHR